MSAVRFLVASSLLTAFAALQAQDRRPRIDVEHYQIEAEINPRSQTLAAKAVIRLRTEPGRLRLEIQDDGVGFGEATTGHGHGLASMRRRAAESGWALAIDSAPGQGTRIRLTADLD